MSFHYLMLKRCANKFFCSTSIFISVPIKRSQTFLNQKSKCSLVATVRHFSSTTIDKKELHLHDDDVDHFQLIAKDGVKISVHHEGPKDGIRVLLVAGLFCDHRFWMGTKKKGA
jgi:hypothetical protein